MSSTALMRPDASPHPSSSPNPSSSQHPSTTQHPTRTVIDTPNAVEPARPGSASVPKSGRGRIPRPWAAPLAKPAARILLAGGLTLAGWLLGGALAGNAAAAATGPAPQCTHTVAGALGLSIPDSSTVDHGRHHRNRAEVCLRQPADGAKPGAAGPASTEPETPAVPSKIKTPLVGQLAALTQQLSTKDTAKPAGGDLVGGLVNGLVGGTLDTVTGTLDHTLGTVTDTLGTVTHTLSHTVLAPLTQPAADDTGSPALLPLDDVLDPVLGSGGSNSGGVTVRVPDVVSATVTQTAAPTRTPAPDQATDPAPDVQPQSARTVVRYGSDEETERPQSLPDKQEQPRDSGVHARGGGSDPGPGLPGGSSNTPSAPASSAAPGHDGPGGARQHAAVHADDVTTTQLKLIGTSRDHEVDGAGREAVLPTTSPD